MSPQGSAHPKLGLSASELLGGLSKCNCSSACGGDEELPICRPAPESKPRLDCVLCVVPSLGARHTSLENAKWPGLTQEEREWLLTPTEPG